MGRKAQLPLRLRIRYAFTGYKMQNLLTLLRKKVPKYALIILLVLSFCYISLHPIHKLAVRYFLTRSCTVETAIVGNYIISPKVEKRVLLEGDWIQSERTYSSSYYKNEDGSIYHYTRDENGQWQRTLTALDGSFIIDPLLLDRSNYRRVKGHLFVWELKPEVAEKIDDISNIRLKRVRGNIAIVGDVYRNDGLKYEISISFSRFGRTFIDAPVED